MPIMSPPFELDFAGRVAPLPSLREVVQPLVEAFPDPMTLGSIEAESAIRFVLSGRLPTFTAANLHAIADAARRADRLVVTDPVRQAGDALKLGQREGNAAPAAMVRVLGELASNRQEVDAALATVADVAALLGASKAVHEVLAERQRQVSVEGFDQAHDAKNGAQELACAAACYARGRFAEYDGGHGGTGGAVDLWPWSPHEFKPKSWRRDCVRAAALLLAALELDDAQQGRAGGAT